MSPWSSNSYKQGRDSIEVKPQASNLNLDKNVKDYNDLISNINYYSDIGANESQQASSNPNIDYSKEAQLIILILI